MLTSTPFLAFPEFGWDLVFQIQNLYVYVQRPQGTFYFDQQESLQTCSRLLDETLYIIIDAETRVLPQSNLLGSTDFLCLNVTNTGHLTTCDDYACMYNKKPQQE